MRTLTHAQARKVYDRIGRRQDSQAFYEDRAVRVLVDNADLASASSVIEFGCGTGRLAKRLLSDSLPADARYLGVDVSTTMAALARQRLADIGDRAEVRQTDGSPAIDEPDRSFDRWLSTFVLDLLSESDIQAALDDAHRLLTPGGRVCLVSATYGQTLPERALMAVIKRVHGLRPQLVGGCRPVSLMPFLPADRWRLLYRDTVSAFLIRSEVIIASPIHE